MEATAPRAASAEINVTPMIDVLLVLLVIFMLKVPQQMKLDAQIPDPDAHGGPDAVALVLEVGPPAAG